MVAVSSLLNNDHLEKLFPMMIRITIPGTIENIDQIYTQTDYSVRDACRATIDTVIQIMLFEPQGSILVYLSAKRLLFNAIYKPPGQQRKEAIRIPRQVPHTHTQQPVHTHSHTHRRTHIVIGHVAHTHDIYSHRLHARAQAVVHSR